MSNVLRSIATGAGVSYEGMTGDFSEVNFSSARMGDLQFRRNIDIWQQHLLIPQFCGPVFEVFKSAAILLGNRFQNIFCTWTPPRRDMIDPTKEIPAKIKAIRAGIETLSDNIRQNGKDPAQHFQEIKTDNDIIDQLELTLDSDPRKTTVSGALQVEPGEENTEENENIRSLG